jgi:hypothetical protein
VTLTCPNGNKNFWTINLAGKDVADVLELPITTPLTSDIPIRPKKEKETKRKGNDRK